MEKVIEITFPNEEVWRIPARVVAESRAEHFVGTYDTVQYQAEIDTAMHSDSELIDYCQNVMDWVEVMRNARYTGLLALYDYAEAFDEATFEVKGE